MTLPKVIYISTVPVEATLGGPALMHRALCDYPPERLLVVQPRTRSQGRRLAGVRYEEFGDGLARLIPARVPLVRSLRPYAMAANAALLGRRLVATARDFGAEAVVTVTHGHHWPAAAAVANRLGLPLHMVNHDNWPDTIYPIPTLLRPFWVRQFRAAYAAAASRLCVSPFMARYYEEHYGAPGEVLLPSRAREVTEFDAPPASPAERPFTVAFAGAFQSGYAEIFRTVSEFLRAQGGQLVLYSNLTAKDAPQFGIDPAAVTLNATMPPEDLVVALRDTADALLLPMQDNFNARMCFPSKLVDYTVAGLPILVVAPLDSAGAVWGKENPAAAVVVDSADREGIRRAVTGLAVDPEARRLLGRGALAAGAAAFSYTRCRDQFFSALRRAA